MMFQKSKSMDRINDLILHFQREKLAPSKIGGPLIVAFKKLAMDLALDGKVSNNSSRSDTNCWPDLVVKSQNNRNINMQK